MKNGQIKNKICMVTTSDLGHDNRILNEANTLALGFDITVLWREYKTDEKLNNIKYKSKMVSYRHFRFFLINILSSFWSITKAAFKENPDVYHTHDLDGLLCVFLPALIKRKTLVYDSHELWSDLPQHNNLKGIHWFLPLLERFLMLKVKYGITVNDSLAKYLEKKYHKPFLSLYNYPDISHRKASPYNLKKLYPGKKILLYLGNTLGGRGVEEVILSLKYLPVNIILVIVSNSSNIVLKKIADEEGLSKRVYFLPAVMPNQIILTTTQTDIGLALTQNNSPSYYYSSPNKLFQYMAAEIPVLGSNFPEFKKFILKNNIGLVVSPNQPRMIAKKIIEMVKTQNQEKYRRNLIDLTKQEYSWEKESQKLIKFYENLWRKI